MNDVIVKMCNVSKRFGHTTALNNVNLDIRLGRIIGLLGANGAGKSTLLRHIIGLYLPDEGQCVTFGCEVPKLGPKQLTRIGYVHQEGQLLEWMTVGQLIRYVRAYYENWNCQLEDKYINDFDIWIEQRVGSLSPGQRQRLAILLAIGFEPELLILDEPASALDPIARSRFLDLLLEIIQGQNRTIIISSHILTDVEKVMDHSLIMKEGKILRDCSFDDLREKFARVKLTSLSGRLPAQLPFENIISCQRTDSQAILTLQNYTQPELKAKAEELNCDIQLHNLTLEDTYKIVVSEPTGVVR